MTQYTETPKALVNIAPASYSGPKALVHGIQPNLRADMRAHMARVQANEDRLEAEFMARLAQQRKEQSLWGRIKAALS